MPATIVETNNTPFRKVDLDPVTLDIIENSLRNARNEMDAVLFRTAMSPGIREQHDAFPMIANQEGNPVPVYHNPIKWFQSGGDGIVVLDWDWARELLTGLDLVAEDLALGERLEAALKPGIWIAA